VVFLLAVLLSIALYLSFLAIGAALLKAFNPSVSIVEVFIHQLPLLYAIFMSPTPGGSGVGEFGAIPVFLSVSSRRVSWAFYHPLEGLKPISKRLLSEVSSFLYFF
jgi:uncharacterized protein (TIRG00374 family)